MIPKIGMSLNVTKTRVNRLGWEKIVDVFKHGEFYHVLTIIDKKQGFIISIIRDESWFNRTNLKRDNNLIERLLSEVK